MQTLKTTFVIFIVGVALFVLGTGWLAYINIRSKTVYVADHEKMGNHVIYSTSMAVLGIVMMAFGGIFVAVDM